ncbi:MAG: lipoprotein [Bacteroidales bacterium]|nr:lipoprotein [Bacteroidales bacterium]
MRKSLIFAVAAFVLAGCAKEAVVAPSSDVTGKVTIYKAVASFNPVSKMTQTSATDDSGLEFFSLGWEAGDVLKCYDAETGYFVGKATEFEVDASDPQTALWQLPLTGEPSSIFAFIDNKGETSKMMFSSSTTAANTFDLDLSSQEGTPKSALLGRVLVAESNIVAGERALLNFENKTAILKLMLTLPADATAVLSGKSVTLSGKGLYSKVTVKHNVEADKATEGEIVLTAPQSDAGIVTAYATVCPGEITGLTAKVEASDGRTYAFSIGDVTVEEGYLYTVERSNSTLQTLIWAPDVVGSAKIDAGLADVTSDADWLTYNSADGTVSIAANTTGKPRLGTLTLPNDGFFKVYQIDVVDLTGNWTARVAKLFPGTFPSNNRTGEGTASAMIDSGWKAGTTLTNNAGAYGQSLDFSNPGNYTRAMKITMLDDIYQEEIVSKTDGTHTNNVLIEGLSDPGLLVKAEIKVDHEAQKVDFAFYMMQPFVTAEDPDKPVKFTMSGFTDYYAWLMPELCIPYTGGSTQYWRFDFGTLGSDSNFWYDGVVTVDPETNKISSKWYAHEGYGNDADNGFIYPYKSSGYCFARQVLSTSTTYYVAGLMVNPYYSGGNQMIATPNGTNGPSAKTLVRNGNKSGNATNNNAAWQYVYQGDQLWTKD